MARFAEPFGEVSRLGLAFRHWAKASLSLTFGRPPRLPKGRAGRAKPVLRPDGGPTQGAGAMKLGGTRASRGRNRVSEKRLARTRDTRAPVRDAGRMAGGYLRLRKLPAGVERSGGPADFCPKRSRVCPRFHQSNARRIVSRLGEDASSSGFGRSQEPSQRQGAGVPE